MMFADIASSTRLYEQLGNAYALDAIGDCLGMMCAVARRFDGRVVKTLGDEVMM